MKIRPIAVVLVLAASCGGCQAAHDKQGAEKALNRGSAAYGRSDFHAAIAECTEAIRLDPACAKAYFVRGLARRTSIDDFDGAADDYSHAIRLDPNWPMPYLSRAYAYRQFGQYGKVIADCTEAIRLKPNLMQAYHARGLAYAVRRDWGKAIADYTEAARLDPKYSGAYYERAMVYKELGQNDKAEADLKRAKELGYGQYGGRGAESGTTPAQQGTTPEASTIPAQQRVISTAEKEMSVDLGKGVKLEMVLIPAGSA